LRFARNGILPPILQRVFMLGPRAELREGTEGAAIDGA
jgi:hypothetical protein